MGADEDDEGPYGGGTKYEEGENSREDPRMLLFDPDVRRIDAKLAQKNRRAEILGRKNAYLVQLLQQNEARNKQQLEEIKVLAQDATAANVACTQVVSKLNLFETELHIAQAQLKQMASWRNPKDREREMHAARRTTYYHSLNMM